ncbi:hypothetical protein EPUL_002799 [Erysiphe pulchra]|uniref:Reverse transcriptase domain-containing protein n=1 Tax=Erysiphe pulchra TaxID=225359 RepID=A0A2S4PRB0_9PEZI|nr:hypothetical protein EPUL_002799 [Erysiphe pulchra]
MPTHNRGGTLDLSFFSDQRARCEIRSDLHTRSDHETLVSTLSRDSMTQTLGKLRYDAIDDNLFFQPLGTNYCDGLEGLVARRISYLALKFKILARNQCSVVSRRSAVDLTTALHCDIRNVWEKGKVAGIVTVDVNGAFDGVLRNHLILKLRRFAYADDAEIISSANSLTDCHLKLQRQLDRTISWGIDNGLGVFFVKKLLFKEHVRRACQRTRIITDHVRQLGNTTRGAKPSLLRQAIQGCVFATLLYGAETWYGPHTSKWALKQRKYVMNRAARAVFPVYKTPPIFVLLRETDWGPVGAWLNRIHDRLAIRTATADSDQPLRRRWKSSHMRWIRQLQEIELSSDHN